jgi:two-component system, OmpR family, sensor kinase
VTAGRLRRGRAPWETLDDRAVRRSRRALSMQLAAAITAVVGLVGGLAYLVTVNRQDAQISMMLDYTISQDRTGAVDPCTWLLVLRQGRVDGILVAPPGLPVDADLDRVASGGGPVNRTVTTNATHYAVRTERYHGEVRQAVFDERYLRSDRRLLLWALLLAEAIGLVIAVFTGQRLACLAIGPLNEALTKQRRFVADASHELRVPITRLHTRTQLLLDRHRDADAGLDAELRRVVDGSRELGELVDDLLGSAGLAASRPAGEPVDLSRLVEAVAEAEQTRARSTGASVLPELPDEPAVVVGIESALRRMVTALVDNGIKYAGPGGHVWLGVAIRDRDRVVEVTVADDGTGIDPADRDRVFDRFHRGGNAVGTGYGLGLALVREVVQAHGGTVGMASRPGGGTEIRVQLPAPGRRSRFGAIDDLRRRDALSRS